MTARTAIQYVEIDMPVCSLTYGTAPCAAALGVTGDARCFNTLATCQDVGNYTGSTVTMRFCDAIVGRDLSIAAMPTLRDASFSPGRIAPGEDLGERSTLMLTFRDGPHSDAGAGLDPYQQSRGYDPYALGTFWGRMRARQPYLRGRAIRWYLGYTDQALAEMECRHFIVQSLDGPSPDGLATIKAIDPLKMLDGDRAQAPLPSNGRLSADITAVATSATLTPTGIGNDEYPASGYLNIGGSEIVSFTRSGDTLTITRGQLGTTASAHSSADRVQVVLRYVAADPADIIYDLDVTYAGMDPAIIPLAEWQAETAAYLRRVYTATIAEPTSVAKLEAELIAQAGLSIWHDDIANRIRLRVLRALSSAAETFSEHEILAGSFSRSEQPNKRLSQVWVFYGQIDPTQSLDTADNYRSLRVIADLEAEANYGSAAIRKIYSRWIAQGGSSGAQRVGDLLLGRFTDPPRAYQFALLRDAQARPDLGGGAFISWPTEQLADGSRETVPMQVLRLKPGKAEITIEAEELTFASLDADDLLNRQVTIDFSTNDVNLRALHDENYPTPTDGTTVTFIVEEGVTIGSTSTATPAIDTGTWPTRAQTATRTSGSAILTGLSVNTSGLATGMRVYGTGIQNGSKILSVDSSSQITLDKTASSSGSGTVTVQTVILEINVLGTVQGAGGAGGTGANGNGDVPGTDGEAGGTALYVRAQIELTDADGALWGGGGGGGGGPCRNPPDHKGGGGGGGAGTVGGAGGVGPGDGREGADGTASAGGAGGHGWTNNNFFAGPGDDAARRGGDGGGPGLAGQNGQGSSDIGKGNGGAAGNAIDGLTKINTVGSAGDRRGGQIN